MLEPLLRTAEAVGLSLDVTSSKALADSLDLAEVSFGLLNLMCIVKLMNERMKFVPSTIFLKGF